MFIDGMKETLNNQFNTSVTENGAVGYKTTGKELLDMNFAVTSMRNWTEKQIIDKFVKVFYEDKLLAVKWLFYARDAREGIGERRLFRACMKYLAHNHQDIACAVIPLIPEYGRWDDLWCLLNNSFGSKVQDLVVELVRKQIMQDYVSMKKEQPISLLAKWMPSINTSSEETVRLARILMKKLGYGSEKSYRQMLSKMRKYLNVVEVKMSSGEWSSIDYSAVPSRANLIYNSAFLRNDEERRRLYLERLQNGETKINAGVLFPHDIVHKYFDQSGWYSRVAAKDDIALEEMWKALPDYVKDARNVLCVSDGSGSMSTTVGNTKVTALEVANALSIYFAERCSGEFKDTYITFSENPQIVDMKQCKSLRQKIELSRRYNEVANTNIEAVFALILQTAINKNMKQEDLPETILILSDMEFDSCVNVGARQRDRWGYSYFNKPTVKDFEQFALVFEQYGYKLPRLVFWNICSRTGTIPVKDNDLGVALVSGFSPAIVKMVLSNKTDPFECLLEQLNVERYAAVENAVSELI